MAMSSRFPKVSPLVLHDGLLWGWADIPGKFAIEVHLYMDGNHVATEVTGQPLPSAVLPYIGRPPHHKAGFCFALPQQTAFGFAHVVQAALPEVVVYGGTAMIAARPLRGEVSQHSRTLAGTVWVDSRPTTPLMLEVLDSEGHCLSSRRLQPATEADPQGFPAHFSLPLEDLPRAPLTLRCNGQILRGCPITPQDYVLGALEHCTPDFLQGWAFNALDPMLPLELALRVDGKVVQWFRPQQGREDIRKLLSLPADGIGLVGFHFTPPPVLFDGEAHRLEIVCAANGQILNDSHRMVHWKPEHRPLATPLPVPSHTGNVSTHDQPAVSVVILNRNGAALLDALCASWERYNRTVPAELIVIDHASKDDSRAVLKRWESRIDLRVVPLRINDSFSASCNRGAALARGKFVLFMNNDIQWLHDALPRMLQILEQPNVGIVGMKLLKVVGESATGKQQTNVVQHLGVRFVLNADAYWPIELEPDAKVGEEEYSPQTVPVVTGATLLCRKTDFDAIGGFDTDYFYGYEDVEICLRMTARLGKQVICANDCVALHHHGHTRLSGREQSVFDRNKKNSETLQKHVGLWLKQAYWQSLLRNDGLLTREVLRIGLVGTAANLAKDLARAVPHAELFVMAPTSNWKRVDGLQLLVVGDPRYDVRAVSHARSDLRIVAWVDNEIASWQRLPWWWDFDAVLVPSAKSAALKAQSKRKLLASTPAAPLGSLLDADSLIMRVCISNDDSQKRRAATLRVALKRAGVECWFAPPAGKLPRLADMRVKLLARSTGKTTLRAVNGTLELTVPASAALPTAKQLLQSLEKSLGSIVRTP